MNWRKILISTTLWGKINFWTFFLTHFSDPPKILRVTPSGGATIGVHNTSILTCSAEGNPLPKYLWLQKLPSNQVLKRGYEDKLVIEDTTYDHQGEYVCEAVNVIGDQKKVVQSEPLRMEVRGKLTFFEVMSSHNKKKSYTECKFKDFFCHTDFSWNQIWQFCVSKTALMTFSLT